MNYKTSYKAILCTIIVFGAIIGGIGLASLVQQRRAVRSLIQTVIANPAVPLKKSDIKMLQESVDKGGSGGFTSLQQQEAFCEAALDRAVGDGNDLLWLVILPAWKETGRFEEVWDLVEKRIANDTPGSGGLLASIGGADRTRARTVVDYEQIFRRSADEMLIIGALLLLDERLSVEHRDAIDFLVTREDVGDKVRSLAEKKKLSLVPPEDLIPAEIERSKIMSFEER